MRTCFVLVILIALNLLLLGCIGSGKAPLETLNYTSEPAKNPNLIVFLQGLGGTTNCFISGHACFESQGFVEAVRSRVMTRLPMMRMSRARIISWAMMRLPQPMNR